MRKIILNLAISLDGFIADVDGGFDWIEGDGDSSQNTEKSFNFPEFVNTVDTIVMGSKAYEDCPIETIESFKEKKILVATSRELKGDKNVAFINGDICSKVLELRKEDGKDIWLFGGAGLTDAFIKADIVDEYIIGIIPIILGKGIPLFSGKNPTIKLHLDECTVNEGITILRYSKR
ncbi:MAG: dihydrofolate reductase family protein [Marinisporobacter sp.]|nr:dihydrofolate reductase family protein [Marinisporobacter sp.]